MPITADRVLEVLSHHIGASKGIDAHTLADEVCNFHIPPHDFANIERQIRSVIVELREQGQHICAHPCTGYYIAATPDELDATCEFLYDRAMCSLKQIAAMKRIAMPDLRGQLHLPT